MISTTNSRAIVAELEVKNTLHEATLKPGFQTAVTPEGSGSTATIGAAGKTAKFITAVDEQLAVSVDGTGMCTTFSCPDDAEAPTTVPRVVGCATTTFVFESVVNLAVVTTAAVATTTAAVAAMTIPILRRR